MFKDIIGHQESTLEVKQGLKRIPVHCFLVMGYDGSETRSPHDMVIKDDPVVFMDYA
jgi:hypothetical protein